jgi:L-glutamate-5-semialdehyde N-acetyltransferase
VPAATRGRGSGRHLAQAFLHYAPKLGYKSSIFNLVFETNVASIRLWENLGFEKVGIVKGAGRLNGHSNLIDAYIYGYQFPEGKATVTQDGAGAG